MQIQIRMALLAIFGASLISAAVVAESRTQSTQEWMPLNMDPEALELMAGTVRSSGPQVISLETTPYRSEGVLEGCGYAYRVLLLDWAYRSNQPVVVYGSIVYFVPQNSTPFLSQRIGLKDIEQREDRLWQRDASVNYAYLGVKNKSIAGTEDSIVNGENGVKVFSYSDPQHEMVQWLLLAESMQVAFNRQLNGTDLLFELPITDYPQAWLDLGDCFGELAGH